MKKENAKKLNKENSAKDFWVSLLLGIFANVRNWLYLFSTTLSSILFYLAMDKGIEFCIAVLGFLFISYIPIFYRKTQ